MGSAKKEASGSGIQRVSGEELREYLKLPIDRELTRPGEVEVRVLPDGRVLCKSVRSRSAATWPSREEYVEWCRRVAEECAKPPVDSTTLLPPIDDFLRDVEAHARSLGPRLRIPQEALDYTVASLGAVDKAVKRIPLGERPVPDLVTPLVAYVGEVLRRASGGRWIKLPPTFTVRAPVFDPDELAAWRASEEVYRKAFRAVQEQGGSHDAAFEAAQKAMAATGVRQPNPIRFEVKESPRTSGLNKPVVMASNGQSFDPFGDVFIPMIEPNKRNPLCPTVESRLHGAGYPQTPKPAV